MWEQGRWVSVLAAGFLTVVSLKALRSRNALTTAAVHEKPEVQMYARACASIGPVLRQKFRLSVRSHRVNDAELVPSGPFKKVHLIRHGEGTHNVAQRNWRAENKPGEPYFLSTDPKGKYEDALLTDRGIEQATALQTRAAALQPQLMIVSPMQRATQTGLIAFAEHINSGLKVLAHEQCHEIGGKHTCDRRLPRSQLQELYPVVDYSLIQSETDPYWGDGLTRETSQHLAERCIEFLLWLHSRPENHVVVAAHSTFLFHLLNAAMVVEGDSAADWFGTGRGCKMRCEQSDR